MAELAALGSAASILQIIDISIRVVKRIHEYRKSGKGFPEALEHISNRLPALIDALQDTKSALDTMTDRTRRAIAPSVTGCLIQIQKLEVIMNEITARSSESSLSRGRKFVTAFLYESGIKEIDKTIQEYMAALTHHHILSSSTRALSSKSMPPSLLPPQYTALRSPSCPFP